MFIPSLRRLARRSRCFMKNQCPVRIRERTMKARAWIILVANFAILMFQDRVAGVEVSPEVELDSDDNEDTLSNVSFDTIEDSSKSTSESVSSTFKQPATAWRRESELIKLRESRKRRIPIARDNSSSQPKVINNIRIVVNNNDSLPNVNSCKRGICGVSVSSKPDGKGNIVTEVRLSIVTRMKSDTQVDDVPVIDGFRGASKESNDRPIFHPTSTVDPLNLLYSYFYRDYTPQIQSSYQGYSEPWYQRRRTLQQPSAHWGYQNFNDRGVGFREHKTWLRERAVADDKIEPPLSKTKGSATTQNRDSVKL